MCAISCWSGMLPKGFLSRWLVQMEVRGRDAVGLAFRLDAQNKSYKQAVPARAFVDEKDNQGILSDARRSLRGIIHTRRASPGMPVDDRNSHPFAYWRYFFAHNGKVANWVEVKDLLITHFSAEHDRLLAAGDEAKAKTAQDCANYCHAITTDSMVLGPYIESRDFSAIEGSLGLVWMRKSNVYAFRHAKECCATTMVWRYTKDDKEKLEGDQMVTLVSSTPAIIRATVEKVPGIEYDLTPPVDFPEGRVFRLEPTGLVDEGAVPTNRPVMDEYSSAVVEEPPADVNVEQPI